VSSPAPAGDLVTTEPSVGHRRTACEHSEYWMPAFAGMMA
jgi:hypothetical protein